MARKVVVSRVVVVLLSLLWKLKERSGGIGISGWWLV